MKKSGAVIIGGTIAVAIGVFMLLSSIPTASNTTTFELPSGSYYYRFETTTLYGGKVSGTYEVTSGDPVRLMVFDKAEFDKYVLTGIGSPISSDSGSTGTFEASLSGMGKLYIVFEHQYAMGATDVSIDYKVSGLAVTFFAIGVVLLVVGVVLAVYGSRMRKKEVMAIPPSPAATDVTFLNTPPPPPQNP